MSDILRSAAVTTPVQVPGASTAPRAGTSRWTALAAEVIHEQRWFIAIALAYLLFGTALSNTYGQTVSLKLYSNLHLIFYLNFAVAFLLVRIVRQLWKHRPERPLGFLWTDLRSDYLSDRRLMNAAPAFLLLPLLLSMTTSIKRMISVVVPFQWDPVLAGVDAWLHGGYQPWELLQPLFGTPFATLVLSHLYSVPWFGVIVFLQFWQIFTLDRGRLRFFITYVLCWALLGNGLAVLASSTGPVYYAQFFDGPNPFAPLMAYLGQVAEQHPLPSAMAQEYLWESYQTDRLNLGGGISAMPSMHVSVVTLLLLTVLRRHWVIRGLAAIYLVVIEIGSVHLGWHYAVDGYVSFAATVLIWWIVGWFTAPNRPVPGAARPRAHPDLSGTMAPAPSS